MSKKIQSLHLNFSKSFLIVLATTLVTTFFAPLQSASAATFNCGTSGSYTVSGGVASGGTNCRGDVTFDSSVTSIADFAFQRAPLGAVVFSSGMTTVAQYGFYLSTMTSLTLNSSFRTIGTAAFVGNGLTSISLPVGITNIPGYAFQGQPFTSLTIPSTVTTIGNYAFSGAVPTTLVIPSSVTSIGEGAFYSAPLRDLRLPTPRPTIGSMAFQTAPLTKGSICLPGNVGVTDGTVNSGLTLTLPTAIDTASSVNDFTIASWIKSPGNYSGGNTIFSIGNPWPYASNGGFALRMNGNMGASNSSIGILGGSNSQDGVLPAADTWFHVAVARVSGQTTVYLNGIATSTYADTNHWTSTSLKIGFATPGVSNGFPGCYSGLVMANSALYTENFASSLTFPATMPTPSGAQVFLNPNVLDPIASWNKASGGPSVSKTGTVNISSNFPSKTTPTLSLALPSFVTTATYGTPVVITATVETPGAVTFKAGGLAISNCTSIAAVSTTATCTWTPGEVNMTTVLTADFLPTNSGTFENLTAAGSRTINVGKATLGITASSHVLSYGSAIPTITPSYSGFIGSDSSVDIANLSCTSAYSTTTAAGTTSSNCSGATSSKYTFAYTAGAVTVTQINQTDALVISSTTGTYGTDLALATTGGSGAGSLSYVVDSGPCTISGVYLISSDIGTCNVTATKAANGNYLAASSVSTAIALAMKNLTISGLTGVSKEFDGEVTTSVTGTPLLTGKVGSDDIALTGTPSFSFATRDVGNSKVVTGMDYGLTGPDARKYSLSQPTVTATITQKAARVVANNLNIALGATVTSSFSTSGLVAGDSITAVTYSYSGTGTTTAPTAIGAYSITPSSAVFGVGSSGNYAITYDTATLTILAKYTTTYNANGGTVLGSATSNVDFVVGDNALTLPTPTRANYTFTGWYTLQTNGVQVSGAYTPTASSTLWAHWVQNSLYGMGANTRLFSLTTFSGAGNTYSVSAAGGTIGIEYLADALPAGTVIDGYLLTDTSTATTLIGANNNYVMSLVLAWVALDGTVPTTATNKAIIMTITNSAIKKGSKIYSVIGNTVTPLGVAASDGSAVISITDDPQIIIAITKPDAPTGVSATTGGNAVSTVSWTAPANDGGSSITSYTAVSNAGQSCTTSATSCQVTGLANGTSYTFTVTALNSIGTSDTSTASVAITPSAPAPVQAPVVVQAPIIVVMQAAISTPVPAVIPTITSLTFAENATKNGGKLVWTGTNIESVLFTGSASTYPAPFNYGAFTLSWDGTLVNMVAGVTYTMKIEARSSTGGSDSKTIAYTIAKPVEDNSAADASLKAAQEKAAAEKKAAEEAAVAALKIAQDKALAEAKAAADAAALKVTEEKAAAEAKAAADAAALKIAQEKAAAEAKAAADAAALKVAQEKAAAEAKAAEEAAALKVAEEKAAADAAALAIAKKTPVLNLFSAYSSAKYTASQTAKMKKLTLKLEPATTLKCVGYINTKGTTAAKAKSIALAQAKTACANAKKLNPSITTVVTTTAVTKAPKPLVGASNTKAKYRVDLFAYKG